ncbi:hypothetical protein AAFF_G00229370 [Aldrovandia affinis]|uniref:APC membrane recruitment protein 3 n=1 Tax=Aldrovandia affinis TaxID=143900 RepID=A0AAD7SXA0_9TELE|nr:hypothetical protein AAFF_G00229370 [Aldrovandia affinis]
MEELPTTPKQSSPPPPGNNISPSMEEGCGERECFGEGCPFPRGRETSINGVSCAQSPASLLTPSPDSQDVPSPAFTDTLSVDWVHSGSVPKSKTHDCLAGMGWYPVGAVGSVSPDSRGQTPTVRRRGRLVSSVSFSGFAVSPTSRARLLRENRGASAGRNRDIIDYHNLTPQVPFVPSFAKSVPKKRISLRRPRRAIKDLLGKNRPKHEKLTSPRTPTPATAGAEQVVGHNGGRKQSRHRECPCVGHLNPHEHNDPLSDSSSDYCRNAYEDVTSLKSFGSQTGCGEIFADGELHPPLEAAQGQVPDRDVCEPHKASPTVGCFQGGVEQMASPAHSEVLDLFGMWDSLGRAILLRQSPVTEGKSPNAPPSIGTPTKLAGEPQAATPHAPARTPELRTDTVTQKSDNQETISTSDEGYYDYISPGQEDTSRDALTPCLSAHFPRDSYSGDALYELFYDPGEMGMTPVFHDEMGLSESVLGLSGDLPLSMYSFHVGAEENLAPPPPLALDLVGQELLQSSWRGKDCLLKLCDTEISLTMGIVNWLKQRAERASPPEPESSGADTRRGATSACRNSGMLSPEVQEVLKSQSPVTDCSNAAVTDPNENTACQPDVSPAPADVPPTPGDEGLASPSPNSDGHVKSRISTPTSGFCFRIFNKDSPLTPDRDLASPTLRSPCSGTSTVFLLAINKDSLCRPCKSSLKQGSKELYLCTSCLSLIEHIRTSDLSHYTGSCRAASPGTPCSLPRGFLDSPISPCMARSDTDILRILEQCVGQVSSLNIGSSHGNSYPEKGTSFPRLGRKRSDGGLKDVRAEEGKGQRQTYLKSKHKRKGSRSGGTEKSGREKRGSEGGSLSHFGVGGPVSPSVLEAGSLGLVTTNSSDELVLETYRSPCSDVSAPGSASNPNSAKTSRPRSLPLSSSAFSEFASSQRSATALPKEGTSTTRGQPRDRARRQKKSGMNRDGPCAYVMPEEKKVERRRRMKK